jgi:hypothetical protein
MAVRQGYTMSNMEIVTNVKIVYFPYNLYRKSTEF